MQVSQTFNSIYLKNVKKFEFFEFEVEITNSLF